MNKSTQDNSPIQSQVEQLSKQIQTCKKFINSYKIDRVTIIFSGVHISISYDEIFVLDKPDSNNISDLQTFFQHLGDVLYSQKLLLEQNIATIDQLAVFQKAAKKKY